MSDFADEPAVIVPSLRSLAAVSQAAPVFRFVNRAVDLDEVAGVIRGYIFIWGDSDRRDAYDTYFDKARPPQMDIDHGAHRRPIKYEHCDDDAIGMDTIGWIDRVWFDDVGLAYEGHLDRTSSHYPRILSELRQGALKTSSGTMPHTASFHDDGAFAYWTLGELSLTATPAEPRMPATTIVRSDSDSAQAVSVEPCAVEDAVSTLVSEQDGSENAGVGSEPVLSDSPSGQSFDSPLGQRSTSMTLEQIMAALPGLTDEQYQAILAALHGNDAAALEDVSAELAAAPMDTEEDEEQQEPARSTRSDDAILRQLQALAREVSTLRNAQMAAPPPRSETRRAASPSLNAPNVNTIPDSRFSNLSASDMWLVAKVLGDHKQALSPEFKRSMLAKSLPVAQERAARGDDAAAWFVRNYTRSDEIMATNISGQGQEWVGVQYATDLWERARVAPIYNTLLEMGMMERTLGQGQNSVYIPTEGADPTWYSSPEANDVSSGRIEVTSTPQYVGAGRVQVTPGVLKATVAWSEELDEDSLIPMASWLNTQLQRSAAEIIEYALINGDTVTTATTNLNLIDGTPGTGASRPAYLATNGMLKLPIITTTSLSYDAGNTLSEDTYLEVLKKLPNEVVANNPERVVFIIGVREHLATMNVAGVKTQDVNSQATIENGRVSYMWGSRVLVSGQMALANSAGKIAGTNPSTTNIYGRILAVAPRYWAVVMKREVRFKLSEDPYNDAQLLRVSLRMGATYRSTTSAAAAAYEVAV